MSWRPGAIPVGEARPRHRPLTARAVRDNPGPPTRIAYWLQAELVAAATDLAEVVGGTLALHLLFNLPLLVGGVITGVVSLVLLAVQNRNGQRNFEFVISGLLLIIAIGFLASLFVRLPTRTGLGGPSPRFDGVPKRPCSQQPCWAPR